MNVKIKVSLLGIVGLVFSIYGYIICEKVIHNIYDPNSILYLKQFEKFICGFMALSIILCIAPFIPIKHSKKRLKRVK